VANIFLSKKLIIPAVIFMGGLLVSLGVLMSVNIARAQSSVASHVSQWTENAGAGISVPACASGSMSTFCSGSQGALTLSTSNLHGGTASVFADFWGGPLIWTGGEGSVTLTGLDSNRTYCAGASDPFGGQYGVECKPTPNCGSTVQLRAALDGAPWSGEVTYDVFSPLGNYTDRVRTVPIDLPNGLIGDYTYTYKSSGPVGATFADITPSATQTLSDGGTITFTFNFLSPPPVNYNVAASIDSGLGTITGPGISCPGDCGESYPGATWVTLIATPSAGYFFTDWTSGAGSICGGQGSTCSAALIDGDKTAGVNFSTSPPPFNYSLSNSGTSNVTKTSGDAFTTNTITKTLTAGVTESVTLSLSGVPAGLISVSISNQGCSPTCTSVITFTVPSITPVGTYPITVTGSPLGRQTNFNLVVSGSPFTVACLASPSPASLGQTVTWTATVSGGTPPLTYAWSGTNIPSSPAPDTNPFSIIYNTIGPKTATVTVTDTDSVQASCPVSTVQIKFDPSFEEF